VRRGARLTL